MKDVNSVRLSGTIFWSKLDDRQTFSILRLGVKLGNGSSVFCSINNPSTKTYDLIKSGNKVLISNGWLDIWEKKDGSSETQIKSNDAGVQFFPKEKALADINGITILGKVLSYDLDTALIEMIGDRNPKTDKPTVRKVKVKIGDSYKDIVGSKIMLEAKLGSVSKEEKSIMTIDADYTKTSIL